MCGVYTNLVCQSSTVMICRGTRKEGDAPLMEGSGRNTRGGEEMMCEDRLSPPPCSAKAQNPNLHLWSDSLWSHMKRQRAEKVFVTVGVSGESEKQVWLEIKIGNQRQSNKGKVRGQV